MNSSRKSTFTTDCQELTASGDSDWSFLNSVLPSNVGNGPGDTNILDIFGDPWLSPVGVSNNDKNIVNTSCMAIYQPILVLPAYYRNSRISISCERKANFVAVYLHLNYIKYQI